MTGDGERSRLGAKLRRAFRTGGDAPAAPPNGPLGELLRRRAARLREGPRARVELPPGRELDSGGGPCWVRELRYPGAELHGERPLGRARSVDWPRVAELARDDALAVAELDECLFLDTETLGLGGGAGNAVFLTGLGWFDGDQLVVEQVLLRSFADEPGALQHVACRLRERPLLVTFVGKTFDRHRLAARMSVCGVDAPILEARHLDLYYLARRRWREELPDVRLRTVEERRLGVFRTDDLPGSEAPHAFLSWLRDGTGAIDRVLEHNRLDVLSLVVLLARLGGG